MISVVGDVPRPGQSWIESATESPDGASKRLSVPLGAWGVVSDVFILLLPISGVLRLQLSPKKRFALIMVFMTGLGYGNAISSIFDDARSTADIRIPIEPVFAPHLVYTIGQSSATGMYRILA